MAAPHSTPAEAARILDIATEMLSGYSARVHINLEIGRYDLAARLALAARQADAQARAAACRLQELARDMGEAA